MDDKNLQIQENSEFGIPKGTLYNPILAPKIWSKYTANCLKGEWKCFIFRPPPPLKISSLTELFSLDNGNLKCFFLIFLFWKFWVFYTNMWARRATYKQTTLLWVNELSTSTGFPIKDARSLRYLKLTFYIILPSISSLSSVAYDGHMRCDGQINMYV